MTSGLMPAKVQIPNLIVAGWWDQEDFYGPLMIYKRQQKGDLNQLNFLVIGPWDHGGWMREHGDHYGPVDLGSDTSPIFAPRPRPPGSSIGSSTKALCRAQGSGFRDRQQPVEAL